MRVVRSYSVKKVLVKISQNSQEDTCKIDLKTNLKMNLKMHSCTVVFSCESCKILKIASAIDIGAKYSH